MLRSKDVFDPIFVVFSDFDIFFATPVLQGFWPFSKISVIYGVLGFFFVIFGFFGDFGDFFAQKERQKKNKK